MILKRMTLQRLWINAFTFSSDLFFLFLVQVTVHVREPRFADETSQQAVRRTTNRRTAGRRSGGTRRPVYSTRAASTLDVEESAEEETAATPSETDEDEEEWSESSRLGKDKAA